VAEYDLPENLIYNETDEWARVEGKRVLVGVTDYAQQQLGDVVFVELPDPGTAVEKGDPFGVIESVKAVSDLYAPVSGEVLDVNRDLADHPEQVNEDCYGDGWMIAIAPGDASELEGRMDSAAYAKHCEERKE
jgi:glycine cleavage system H protein